MYLSYRASHRHCRRISSVLVALFALHAVQENCRAQQALHDRARAAEKAGEIDSAIQIYTEAIEAGKLSVDELAIVYHRRGALWAMLCENGRAIEDFTQSIVNDPAYGYSYSLRGYLRGVAGLYELAAQDHLRAIELADSGWKDYLPWALQHRADLWRRQGEFKRALQSCDEALQHGEFAVVHFRRAWIHLELRDYPGARTAFEKCMARAAAQDDLQGSLWPDERIAMQRLQRLFGTGADQSPAAGVWDISGVDDQKTSWIATLVLSEDADRRLSGYFDWIGSNGHCGREFVAARFDPRTRLLEMTGSSVKNSDRVVPSRYRCKLPEDGSQLMEGQWLGTNIVPGKWSGTRVNRR